MRNNPAPRDVQNILVVLRNNQIGDLLCSQPLYTALKKRFSTAAITVLAAPTNYEVPFHELNPYIDHVEYYDRSLVRSIPRMLQIRARRRYQIGIVPSTIKVSFSLHLLNRLVGAPIRVGIRSLDGVKNPGRMFLNLLDDFHWNTGAVHQRERNRDIARLLDCDVDDEELFRNQLRITDENIVSARERLRLQGIDDDATLIGIHPGAGDVTKMWPIECFAELCGQISSQFPARFVTAPGPIDWGLVPRLQAAFAARNIPIHVIRNEHIGELFALFRRLRLFVTNDTGTLHIAAALGTETVLMTLPAHASIWTPRLQHVSSLLSPTSNIEDISVNAVFEACRTSLSQGS